MPSKGAPNMLPNVLPHADSDHIPVLADEVRELLAVRPGETVVDATFGAGGHARLLAQDLAGRGKLVAIDRDPGAKSYFDRFKAAARGRRALPARRLRGRADAARCERHQRGRDPARPRHLVDAGRPARARLLVRDRRAARHADGPVVRDERGRRSSTRGTSASSPRSSGATARSVTRRRSRGRSSGDAPSGRSRGRASSSTRSSSRSRRRRASARVIPPSGSSRRCASP